MIPNLFLASNFGVLRGALCWSPACPMFFGRCGVWLFAFLILSIYIISAASILMFPVASDHQAELASRWSVLHNVHTGTSDITHPATIRHRSFEMVSSIIVFCFVMSWVLINAGPATLRNSSTLCLVRLFKALITPSLDCVSSEIAVSAISVFHLTLSYCHCRARVCSLLLCTVLS